MAEKLKNKEIRKITKVAGHSFSVTLPVEIVEKLGWKEHQKVVVELEGRHVVIKDWKSN